MRTHTKKIGENEWTFNSIDPFIICDHQAEVVGALTAGWAGMLRGDSPNGRIALSYMEISKAMPPERWAFHRQLILGSAHVCGMLAIDALKKEKIDPLEANEGLMEGLVFNYRPFSEGAGSFLARLAEGTSQESKTSGPGGPSGG